MRIGGSTRLLALLGDPIAHTLSPAMYNAGVAALGLDAVYVALRTPAGSIPETFATLAALGVAGNVTVPHKGAAERCVARKTDLCTRVGACNTFWVEDGVLVGDNTDARAVAAELGAMGVDGGRWLLVGAGGSARAVAVAAADAGAELLVRSRDPARARGFVEWASAQGSSADLARLPVTADLVVNATPLGLAAADPLPIEPEAVRGLTAALDLVYAPGEPRWVRELRRVGVVARDGRGVLVRQGAFAWERFFPDHPAPVEIMHAAVERALRE